MKFLGTQPGKFWSSGTMGASCGPVEVRGLPKSWCSSSGGGGGGKGGDWEPGRAKFKLK